jgi:hypothetical protein
MLLSGFGLGQFGLDKVFGLGCFQRWYAALDRDLELEYFCQPEKMQVLPWRNASNAAQDDTSVGWLNRFKTDG